MRSTEDCNGCGACYNVCPHHAILMKTDRAGYLKFTKDSALCVHCGRCDEICASLSSIRQSNYGQQVFAAWAKSDEIHRRGNSGGLFEVAARAILKEGGVVTGAAYDKDFNVNLSIAENEDELPALIGSKFVQSNPGYIYKELKGYLDADRWVLFVGAPCQVKALYAVLQKDYPKLITVQFHCFGMPPLVFWKKYLKKIREKQKSPLVHIGSEVQINPEINSRYMVFTWQNGEVYSEKFAKCAYLQAWNNGFAVSDVCASCRDGVLPTQSDLIWGNFWHIGEIEKFSAPKEEYQDGVSMLMINSKKGEAFFEKIKSELVFYPRKFIEAAAPHFIFQSDEKDHFFFKKKYESKQRLEFQKDLSALSYEQIVEKYFSQNKQNGAASISRLLGPKFAAWGWRAIYYLQKILGKRH